MSGDHEVVGADDVALFFECASDVAVMTGGVGVEIKHCQAGGELFDGGKVAFGVGGFHGTIDQFGLCDGGDAQRTAVSVKVFANRGRVGIQGGTCGTMDPRLRGGDGRWGGLGGVMTGVGIGA